MTIDGLNALTTLTAGDELPVWDVEASAEEPTKKITASNLAASVKTLGSLVNTTEMNNALAGKQNTLTFDTTPTTGSTNPVTSGGTADAIAQSTATGGAGYFKSPDGTLIQWGVVDSTGQSGMDVNFSISFVGNPNIYMTPYYNSVNSIRCIYAATPATAKFTLTAYDTSTGAVSTATNLNFRWIAIGRWK